ncbi:MAG: translation initiation factor IF-2 [Thermostichales cyanobacterium SZTDM-1c_bins_54]
MPISENLTSTHPTPEDWESDSKRLSGDKIRIYDLSREMGRDNKDILEACDHLKISYKSHSSTISAEQADQIRAYFQHAPQPSPRSPRPTPAKERPTEAERPPERRLVIRAKPVATPVTTPETPPVTDPAPPSLKTPPPRPVARPQGAAPTPPPAPVEKPSPVSSSSSAKPVAPARPALNRPVPPKPQSLAVSKPTRPERPEKLEKDKPEPKPVTSTLSPPRRPTPPAPPSQVPTPQPKTHIVKGPTPPTPVATKPEPSPGSLVEGPLRKPSRGSSPEILPPPVPLVLEQPPSRPMPPRPPAPIEEEEDEETLIAKRTLSKGQSKKKRRRSAGDDLDGPDEVSLLVEAHIPDVAVYKPLPRPTAKPGGSATPAVASHRPKKSQAAPSRPVPRPPEESEPAAASKPTHVVIDGDLTVQELAERLQIPETQIIKHLFLQGKMVTITQVLEASVAEKVAQELGYTVERASGESQARKTEMLDIEDIDHLVTRPPVVTIMGHVDHGKTTLLDAIRQSKVAAGEAGGITQHIGAYHVDVPYGNEMKRVVFLDTPGHEAFTAMRARGAKVTDIAVLVVAADDGVQPQTLEALSHAKAAQVPIVVAINKIDKPDAQPDRIKQELSEHGLVPEEWGGDTPMVPVSALTRRNLDTLLETILIVAEVAELQANPNRPGKGTVIEANMDKSRGPVATMLVQNGTLRVGDAVVAGAVFGRVKAMMDDRGQRVTEAPPSSAVQILGLSGIPAAGDEFEVYEDESVARQVAKEREEALRQQRLQQNLLARRVSLGTASSQAQEGQLKELNIILKTDVQGSAEAIVASLQQLPSQEVQLRVLLAAPGEITETDIDLAAASNALVIGFNTSQAPGARQAADRYGVDIREYDIIYNLLEDIRAAMEGMLEPDLVEEPLGQAEVRQVIPVAKGLVAGCYVLSGKVQRNAYVRVLRKGEVIHTGRIDSLRRFKDDVREVAAGFECGIIVEKFNEWQGGEILDVYQMVTKRRTLTPAK